MKKNIRKSVVLFCMVLLAIGGIGFCIDHYRDAREAVQVVSERVLIPGGQSVGIKMNVKGVLVVGLEEIETADGIVSPGCRSATSSRRSTEPLYPTPQRSPTSFALQARGIYRWKSCARRKS